MQFSLYALLKDKSSSIIFLAYMWSLFPTKSALSMSTTRRLGHLFIPQQWAVLAYKYIHAHTHYLKEIS